MSSVAGPIAGQADPQSHPREDVYSSHGPARVGNLVLLQIAGRVSRAFSAA